MMLAGEGIGVIVFVVVIYLVGSLTTKNIIRVLFKSKLWIVFWPLAVAVTIFCFIGAILLAVLADLLEP